MEDDSSADMSSTGPRSLSSISSRGSEGSFDFFVVSSPSHRNSRRASFEFSSTAANVGHINLADVRDLGRFSAPNFHGINVFSQLGVVLNQSPDVVQPGCGVLSLIAGTVSKTLVFLCLARGEIHFSFTLVASLFAQV